MAVAWDDRMSISSKRKLKFLGMGWVLGIFSMYVTYYFHKENGLVMLVVFGVGVLVLLGLYSINPVSYTHLTLPTN